MVAFGVAAGIVGVWLACGGMGGYVAHAKDRAPAEGAVFGLLLGPLGVLVEALLPEGARPARAPVRDDFRVQPGRWDTDRRNWFDPVQLR